jgi:CBS domain containing-hemolysin-like protein
MAPVSETPLNSFYSSITAFVAKAIAWLAAQPHNVRDAIAWTGHLPSRVTSWIILAFTWALHRIGFALIAIAKFLVLLIQAIGAVLLVMLILTALCHLARQLWKNRKRLSNGTRFPPAIYPSMHVRRRIPGPMTWPRYGTMDSISPGKTVSRVRVEELSGLGWRHTIYQSVPRHVGGRTEHVAEAECEAEQHGLDF